jgi:hypothetical protein
MKHCLVSLGLDLTQMALWSSAALFSAFQLVVPLLAASRSMRQRASHPMSRPAARNTICSATMAEAMVEFLRALSVLIRNSPAEVNVRIDPINMSKATRFTRRCSLSVEFGGFTRAQLIEKEA